MTSLFNLPKCDIKQYFNKDLSKTDVNSKKSLESTDSDDTDYFSSGESSQSPFSSQSSYYSSQEYSSSESSQSSSESDSQ